MIDSNTWLCTTTLDQKLGRLWYTLNAFTVRRSIYSQLIPQVHVTYPHSQVLSSLVML
jgi:hypothetical protein